MESFILIYFILTANGATSGTAQFGGYAACITAGEQVIITTGSALRDVSYVCVRQNGKG